MILQTKESWWPGTCYCDECKQSADQVIQFGEDTGSVTDQIKYVCLNCLKQAVELVSKI